MKEHEQNGSVKDINEDDNNLEQKLKETEGNLTKTLTKNENIIKKNMSLEKELKRMNLAFNESLREKTELIREMTEHRRALTDAVKQNTVLKEEVRVKAEFIHILKEQLDSHEVIDDVLPENDEASSESEDTATKESRYDKCGKC